MKGGVCLFGCQFQISKVFHTSSSLMKYVEIMFFFFFFFFTAAVNSNVSQLYFASLHF